MEKEKNKLYVFVFVFLLSTSIHAEDEDDLLYEQLLQEENRLLTLNRSQSQSRGLTDKQLAAHTLKHDKVVIKTANPSVYGTSFNIDIPSNVKNSNIYKYYVNVSYRFTGEKCWTETIIETKKHRRRGLKRKKTYTVEREVKHCNQKSFFVNEDFTTLDLERRIYAKSRDGYSPVSIDNASYQVTAVLN